MIHKKITVKEIPIEETEKLLDIRDNDRYALDFDQRISPTENGTRVAVDNSTRDFYMEEFKTRKRAIKWLYKYDYF